MCVCVCVIFRDFFFFYSGDFSRPVPWLYPEAKMRQRYNLVCFHVTLCPALFHSVPPHASRRARGDVWKSRT